MTDKDLGSNRQGDLPTEPVFSVWWLSNLAAENASLRAGAPEYMKDQLSSRKGRNGRGRLWSAFGGVVLGRFEGRVVDDLRPGGIVIRPEDARYCIGGYVQLESTLKATTASAVGTDERSEEVNQNNQVIP